MGLKTSEIAYNQSEIVFGTEKNDLPAGFGFANFHIENCWSEAPILDRLP
jgi:hypothetical protein